MEIVYNGVTIIENMTRKDFHQKIVKGIGKKRAFGAIASFGAEKITLEQKAEVRKSLASIGIPLHLTSSDDDLDAIIETITARAVSLR